jgi:hypothetical protein
MRNQSLTRAALYARMRRCLFASALLFSAQVHASYHLWVINEIYSNADGSVQFIELRATASSQEGLSLGATLIARDTNEASHTYVFTNDLPSAATFQRTMLLATPAFASMPGAVTPDFIIEPNFLFINAGSLQYPDVEGLELIDYTDLPTDGVASLARSLNNQLVYNPTNSPRNFANQTGSVRPAAARLLAPTLIDAQFVFSFDTTTTNNYTVEATDSLAPTNWQDLVTMPGSGSLMSVTNDTSTPSQRFYRLRVE